MMAEFSDDADDAALTPKPPPPPARPPVLLLLLFGLFGLGSWVAVNGLFAELPALIASLPEGPALPAYISVAIQASNAFMLAYVGLRLGCRCELNERVAVALVLVMGTAGLLMLVFFWDTTVGAHSVLLLALATVTGIADTMSSVVFLPVMSHYPRLCSVPFAVGEACTSLVAAAVAIVQDPGGANRFGPSVYFAVLAAVMVASGVGYVLILHVGSSLRHESVHRAGLVTRATATKLATELAVMAVLNFCENGILVSLLAMCMQPYGAGFYKAALWGGMAAAPLGTLLPLWVARGTPAALFFVWSPLCSLVLVNSILRPPLASNQAAFGAFMVVVVVVARFALGYCKSLIYVRVLEADAEHDTAKEGPMLMVGFAQQFGSTAGALLFFLLVYYQVLVA